MPRRISLIAALATVSLTAAASAQEITVTVENLQGDGGFSLTPLWVGFHDGTYSNFQNGMDAADFPGLEDIAELGNTDARTAAFASAQPGGVQMTLADTSGAPVFSPGESSTYTINVGDATANRFMSFAAMVVPSNDLFVGNPDAGAELFDAMGNFNGPFTIDIFGTEVWNAGTEVNDFANGPAFVMGQDAMAGTVENGLIQPFFNDADAGAYLASATGLQTPVNTIGAPFGESTPLYRITVVPEPASLGVLGLGGLLLVRRRQDCEK